MEPCTLDSASGTGLLATDFQFDRLTSMSWRLLMFSTGCSPWTVLIPWAVKLQVPTKPYWSFWHACKHSEHLQA